LKSIALPDAARVRAGLRLHALMLCAALLASLSSPVWSRDASGIGPFHHTAWTIGEGAPGNITALTQAADGFLWIGTEVGLFRFDGLRFEHVEQPADNPFPATSISALYTAPDGGLWIGFRYGGISVLDGDNPIHHGEAEGLRLSTVYRFQQDRDGVLWAATFRGLIYLQDGRWHQADAELGVPGEQAYTVFVDAAGAIWVATDAGIAVRRRGAVMFERLPVAAGRVGRIGQAPNGDIWLSKTDGDGVLREPHHLRTDTLPRLMVLPSTDLLFDRSGALWATTLGNGILRQASAGDPTSAMARFSRRDGLSSDYQRPVIEDHEGNIWVGGSLGLDRFRRSNLVSVRLPDEAHDFAITSSGRDTVLIATRNLPPMRTDGIRTIALPIPPPITAVTHDSDGVAWLAGTSGLWRADESGVEHVAALPTGAHSGVQAIARTRDGALWLSLNSPGVYRWQEGTWRHIARADGMPGGASPLVLLASREGPLWMGFAHGLVGRIEGLRVHTFALDDFEIGNVTAFSEGAGHLWIGGERGLLRYADGSFEQASVRGDPLRGITGIIEEENGDLWLNAAVGVVRMPAAAPAAPQTDAYEIYDAVDGLPGAPAQFRPIPTASLGSDGRLWFATAAGVVTIEPAARHRNPIAPPVAIRGFKVDGQAQPLDGTLQLPAATGNLEIEYTALSLSVPERTRFRYRLEGFDGQWQEAGNRRSAFYTEPGPGRYTFRVIAANADGVWNDVGATLSFSIRPHYYQTPWFRALCAVLVVSALWALYLLRLRHLYAQVRLRLGERHAERERIARELHDTLLQGVQGLILRLHVVSRRLRADEAARAELETAMTLAERTLAMGRDRVRGLRGNIECTRDLGNALLQVAEEAQGPALPAVRMHRHGEPRVLMGAIAEEAYMIGREALLNAFHHASAHQVRIDIAFEPDALRLAITDDGIGLAEASPRPGHFGMEGMRERSERIGATLDITSAPGAGTRIELCVPGGTIYRDATRPYWWRRWMPQRD